jgi:hypothetical protein
VKEGDNHLIRANEPTFVCSEPACRFSAVADGETHDDAIRSFVFMTCAIATINRAFLVRWSEPTMQDVQRVLAELAKAQSAAGVPLYFVAIIPQDSAPPPADVRKAMDVALARACDTCASVHFVVEGEGFKHTILRTILAANILASGRRGKVFVASSAEEMVEKSPHETRMELAAIMMLAGSRALVRTVKMDFPQPDRVRHRPTG